MDSNTYLKLAALTESPRIPLKDNFSEGISRMLHSALGCGDESGEIIKLVKDHLYYGKELTFTALKEEYGDLLWFIAQGLNSMSSSFEEVMTMNIAKLRTRYPEKFQAGKAINRDVNAELQVLERFVADIKQEAQSAALAAAPLNNAEIWRGSPITICQMCEQQIGKRFIDGQTKGGSWGILCPACHATNGVGLGTGKGQEYVLVGAVFLRAPRPKLAAGGLTKLGGPGIPTVPGVTQVSVNQTMIDLITEADLPADAQIKCDIGLYHAVMTGQVSGKIIADEEGGFSLQLRTEPAGPEGRQGPQGPQ